MRLLPEPTFQPSRAHGLQFVEVVELSVAVFVVVVI
jgi:hypothetical protein